MKTSKLSVPLALSFFFLSATMSHAAPKTPHDALNRHKETGKVGPSDPYECIPKTCEEMDFPCGDVSNGCGEALGTKQVSYEWTVHANLPPEHHYIYFSASGAGNVKVPFTMNCTKVYTPGGGLILPQ